MKIKCNGVFEGGGIKAISLAGAVEALEESDYEFVRVAGTSAGAIIAALLAVGYTSSEIKDEIVKTDYLKFKQEDFVDKLGNIGKALSVGINFGIYSSDYFEEWLNKLLQRKKKTKFGDIIINDNSGLSKYKLQVTTVDITTGKLHILPKDLELFGINPDTYDIAKAVRMSMSIPFFYEPFKLLDSDNNVHLMVDGALISNYPIWILDDGSSDIDIPTFGFRFIKEEPLYNEINNNIIEYGKAIVKTVLDSNNIYGNYKLRGDMARTISISTNITIGGNEKVIEITDFDITEIECIKLYQNGLKSGRQFVNNWNFKLWKKMFR